MQSILRGHLPCKDLLRREHFNAGEPHEVRRVELQQMRQIVPDHGRNETRIMGRLSFDLIHPDQITPQPAYIDSRLSSIFP